jgi:alpha/beta superfamily hydrolase
VAAAERAARAGVRTLRFDFGGVGLSEGDRGDRAAHVEDLRRALAHVAAGAPGVSLLAGGFSYGARAALRLANPATEPRPALAGLLLLAPATRVPRSARDFGNLLLGRPLADGGPDAEVLRDLRALAVAACVLVGERDVVAPPDEIRAAAGPRAFVEVLPHLNHFFSASVGAGPTARDALDPALDRALSRLVRSQPPI